MKLSHKKHPATQVAVIDEQRCIGCTLCIKACPVDAITGSETYLHAVLSSECIGCELCIAPCPVDCISMQTIENSITPALKTAKAQLARTRHKARSLRLQQTNTTHNITSNKADYVAQALARAKAKRSSSLKNGPTAHDSRKS